MFRGFQETFLIATVLLAALLQWVPATSLAATPIVYGSGYEFDLFGVERFHPFSRKQYRPILSYLVTHAGLAPNSWITPQMLHPTALLAAHSRAYLSSLEHTDQVFGYFEKFSIPKLRKNLPFKEALVEHRDEIAQRIVASQMLAASGTVLATKLALEQGVPGAISLGGGFHHANRDFAWGFCLIADSVIAIRQALKRKPSASILIIDLDAHHGDGNADAFHDNPNVSIFDVYNAKNFPVRNLIATGNKNRVEFEFPIPPGTRDGPYLDLLEHELPRAMDAARWDLIFYNAGTDIYEDDPVGGLKISAAGIAARDALVFSLAKKHQIPVAMVLSGGYAPDVSEVIGKSLENLANKNLISLTGVDLSSETQRKRGLKTKPSVPQPPPLLDDQPATSGAKTHNRRRIKRSVPQVQTREPILKRKRSGSYPDFLV